MPAPGTFVLSGQALVSRHSLSALTPVPARLHRLAGSVLRIEAAVVTRKQKTQKRHKAIRNKVNGSSEQPRLAVYRSNNHIYAQVVDDEQQHTLVAASTLMPEIRGQLNGTGGANKEAAVMVGKKIAELCLQKNIEKVCFDRGGNIYHGRVQALAEAAREVGLVF
ncbi:50S ribosomal protein L18, chloroplastic [Trebouxia sp. C0010 RCD-2024]